MNRDGTGKDTTTSTAQSSEAAETKDEGRSFVSVPSAWIVETARQMADGKNGLVDGDWIESDDMDPDGNIQIVQLAHIGEGRFKGSPERFINRKFASEENCTLLEAGDLLISRMSDPILRSCLLPDFDVDSVMAVDIARLTPSAEWNKYFVACLFNSRPIWAQGVAWSAGSTRKRISRKNIEKIRLPKPPLDEQRKIASVLYTVDQLVERTKAIVDRLQSVKRGLLQDLIFDVQGPLTHEQRFGPLTFRVPRSWSRVRLGEVTSLITRGRQPEYADEGVPVINQECIYWDGFRWGNIRYLDREAATEWKERYFPKTGDILINSTGKGTLGRAQVYRRDGGHVVDSHVTIVRPDPERLLSSYLRWLLESKRGQGLLYSMCVTGSTGQIELSKSKLSLLSIPLPPIEEQERIVEGLEEVQANIRQNQYFQQRAKRLKRGLMQDLLSGKVRIDDVEIDVTDEVARYG